ncbi:MAG: sigma-54-dependent Fis family transcriptional regulator [Devosia sp.]|uniref:sigma-54-dependent transcriptional regulator n=1 Tax=Devosia sp. TaxID=1871048 RepID=UPI0024C88A4D|nr:sigma-54 dependent transcriptional regulator [Devosia sp.]UYO00533.1 MAG: sigma-54-dependent Fis family transcriptional regulator [Devosia sp.]
MTDVEVLFCDDDPEVLDALTESFQIEGLRVLPFSRADQALLALSPQTPAVVLTDVRMPVIDGLDLLTRVQAIDTQIPVLLLTGHGDVPMAVQALRNGAWDFFEKPADPLVLVQSLKRAMVHRAAILENRRLKTASRDMYSIEGRVLGSAPATAKLRDTLARLATSSVDVLLLGETGTGKEVAARILHDFSGERDRPFVAVNCGALAESMIESELFGHEAGAFTGAGKQRIGMVEYADGGTLFLDEIEAMPMAAQVRLLRVLQERRVVRLGSNREVPVKLRVVTAAKEDLVERSRRGLFREDLAYRLDVARIDIPPLRKRPGDADLLFDYFLALAAEREGQPPPAVSPALRQFLSTHDWPGNVREVRNRAERYFLGLDELSPSHAEVDDTTLQGHRDQAEVVAIAQALRANNFRAGRTADALGISRKTLYLKMQKYGLRDLG